MFADWSCTVLYTIEQAVENISKIFQKCIFHLWVWYADVTVPVTLTPSAHGEMCNTVVIGLQHLRVSKHLVSESVQASKGNSKNFYFIS